MNKITTQLTFYLSLIGLLFLAQLSYAKADEEIHKIINAKEEPAGIVFEIASGSEKR